MLLDFRFVVILDHHLQIAHMLLQHVVEILVGTDGDRLVFLGWLRLARYMLQTVLVPHSMEEVDHGLDLILR